jgi:hypothetical protein
MLIDWLVEQSSAWSGGSWHVSSRHSKLVLVPLISDVETNC